MPAKAASTARGFVVERVLDAQREAVFRAWTDPEILRRWWAPAGCTTPACTVDLRPGGRFHFCIRTPDGQDVWGLGLYREVVRPERLVYVDSFADAKGNPVPASHYGASADHPDEALVTVTFVEEGGRTRLTLRHEIPEMVAERGAVQKGWGEMLDRLAVELEA